MIQCDKWLCFKKKKCARSKYNYYQYKKKYSKWAFVWDNLFQKCNKFIDQQKHYNKIYNKL